MDGFAARHIIPAATKWDTWHQLDADEEACPYEDAAVTAEDDKEDYEFVDRILNAAESDDE